MLDEEQKAEEVIEQIAPESTAEAEKPQEHTETPPEQTKESKPTSDKDYNFKELRRAKEEAERAFQLERQRNQEMFELLKRNQQPATQQERDVLEEELSKLSPDDLATISNVDKKLTRAQKYSKKEVDDVKQQLAEVKAQLEEQKFRTKYPDVDDVLSPENIEALKKEDPEIAEMIGLMPKGSKEQVVMAYKYIKKLILQKTPDNTEKKIALDNLKKPRSAQTIATQSPIGAANAFATMNPSKDEKAAIWKQMQEDMKRG